MHGTPAYYVRTKFFAKLTHDGRCATIHVDSLDEKEALLAAEPAKLTTTPHYDGYRMVLVVLARVTKTELREFVTESWRLRAPKKLLSRSTPSAADRRSSGPRSETASATCEGAT